MKTELTKEEILIEFFNMEYENSDTNEVVIDKNDVKNLNISEREASRIIHLLQEENMLHIKQKSIHNDFSMYWTIALMSPCIHYFENKKFNKKEQRRILFNEIRAWITLAIAIVALIHSIYTTNSKSDILAVSEPPVLSVSDNQAHIP